MIRRVVITCVVTLGGFASFDGHAMFISYATRQVPIGRLFTNLQVRLARNTNDFEATYDLARLHSMAYSTNFVTFRVRTNSDRPEFYWPGSDSGVPKAVFPAESPDARTEARKHL